MGIALLSKVASGADKIRIGYSGATISNAMLWVTDEAKLFQKNGIDPEILYLQTTLGQTALIAGEIDMCVYSGSLLSAARLQGADVVMVASFLNKPIYRLVVRPEIRAVTDLRGKRLGITRFGTVTDSTTRLLVGRLGLDPDKDVILVQVGEVPVLLTSLDCRENHRWGNNSAPLLSKSRCFWDARPSEYAGDGHPGSANGSQYNAEIYCQESRRGSARGEINH